MLAVTHVGVITQARTTSTRLPGKVLLQAGGKTMLDHHLDRLARSGLDVYVATTTNRADDAIVSIAAGRGLGVHRGSEHDVLGRFADCAQEFALDVVVRVTSDCPLIDGQVLADAVTQFLTFDDPRLYMSNGLSRTFPRGFDFEIFTSELLSEANQEARLAAQREHVTPYMYVNAPGDVSLCSVAWPTDKSSYRVTLDTVDDLRLITELIEHHDAAQLDCGAIIDLLDRRPDLVSINSHVEQKKLDETSSADGLRPHG